MQTLVDENTQNRLRRSVRRPVVWAVLVTSLVALFPVSAHLADPLFSRTYDARFEVPVLLVFPEHIEVRWVKKIAEVAPPPKDPSYTFSIPRDQQAWVEHQIQALPPPRPGSFWKLRIEQLRDDTQRVDLEAYGDGFTGLIYQARKTSITPIAYRRAGPGAALLYVLIDVGLSCAISIILRIVIKSVPSRRSHA